MVDHPFCNSLDPPKAWRCRSLHHHAKQTTETYSPRLEILLKLEQSYWLMFYWSILFHSVLSFNCNLAVLDYCTICQSHS